MKKKELLVHLTIDNEFPSISERILTIINEEKVDHVVLYDTFGNVEMKIYFPYDTKVLRNEYRIQFHFTSRYTGEEIKFVVDNKTILDFGMMECCNGLC